MSKQVTKIVVRVFFILVLFALVPFFYGDQDKFQHLYFAFPQKWQMVFPLIIITSFLFLLISCAVKRFNNPGAQLAAGSQYDSSNRLWCSYFY